MKELILKENKERIDKVLSDQLSYSRSKVTKMLKDGCIKVNGNIVKPSYVPTDTDHIQIIKEYEEETNLIPTKMDLDILYEDQDLLVINKPTGLVVHPGNGNPDHTLANGLLYYTQSLSDKNGSLRPGIVHRIDKDTSGILLVAKTNEAHEKLALDFQKHQVKKEYIALLKGVFPHNEAKIDAPIGRDKLMRKKMTVTSLNSKPAITYLKVLKRYKEYTLVKLNLETGRTHQIRVHMKYIGYPIFNDPVYGQQKIKEVGQFLHSASITFVHPTTKKEMSFSCPLPDYFQEYLNTLEEI